MPSDANGVYSLPSGYEAVTGETIQASQHNPPLEDLASSMSARLMRTGAAPMTGPLKIADGSVGSPGLAFNTDTTSGIYKTANGWGVSVGGVKVAEFTSSGLSRMIGELIPWTRLSAPSGWVLPYGQTLSRTTYADLWAIAQTEIAGGNTFFNNGDGSTTFGIADLRGRVVAGKDNMGGVVAGRLGSGAGFSGTDSKDPSILGAYGGRETHTITTAQLPPYTPSGTVATSTSGTVPVQGNATGTSVPNKVYYGKNDTAAIDLPITVSSSSSFTGNAQGGTSAAHNNTQPTMICNYILFAGA